MSTIGVQAMMLRGSVESVGVFETLRKVSAIGYHAVEISQIPMTPENVAEMARARDELGMDIAALSASTDVLTEDLPSLVADCHALGATNVRIGMLPLSALESRETVLEFCRTSDRAARRLLDEGVTLYYHNHHIDFMRFDGVGVLDLINENAPAMRLELDVHWVQRGGRDPVSALRAYADRTDLVHLKDYRIGHIPADLLAAIAAGDREASRTAWNSVVQFAEVGEGSLDFRGIVEQAVSTGVSYLFVEQDEFYGRDPFDCLVTSRENLLELGFEHLF